MANNLSHDLLDDQADHDYDGDQAVDGFDELKGSLDKISKFWEKKKKASFNFSAGIIEGDTRAQWRKDLAEFLESTPVHVFIVVLLLTDLFATAVDILKTIHIKTTDLDTCVAYLERGDCVDSFEGTKPWEVVFWISIAILSVLALNVLLLLVAFGFRFWRNPGYVLDAFVVGTALLLEIFLSTDTVGLLVILTLWRIVRVAHGIFEVTDEAWEKEINSFKKRLADAESAHDELLREKDQRIAELERALKRRY
ncbi:unnamed protein product [Calypogeia fissa]